MNPHLDGAVVRLGLDERDHVALFVEQVYERQEQVALEAVLVELLFIASA